MRAQRFFVDRPLEPGATVSLTAEQARQARSVLRLRAGDALELFNGTGIVAQARVVRIARDDAEAAVEIVRQQPDQLPLDLTVGLALLRGERFDLAAQKLTETGASRIVPLTAQHCVVSYAVDGEWNRRAVRLRRIAIEAAEQSERTTIPQIAPPTSIEDFLAEHATNALALVERSVGVQSLLEAKAGRAVALAIGPEGGWSASEREVVTRLAQPVSLGPLILRAETAAIVAAGTLMQRGWSARQHEKED